MAQRTTLGERLRRAIDRQPPEGRSRGIGLLISKIKGVTGATYPSIASYLEDDVKPPLEFLEAAATALGVRLAWLAFGEGEMTKAEQDLLGDETDQADGPLSADLMNALREGSEMFGESRLDYELLLEVLRRWIRAHGPNDEPEHREVRKKAVRIWELVHKTIPAELRLSRMGVSMPDEQWASYKVAIFQALALAVPTTQTAWIKGTPEGRFTEMIETAEMAVAERKQKHEETEDG